MKRLLAMLLVLTMLGQMWVPAWAEAPEETVAAETEATETAEEQTEAAEETPEETEAPTEETVEEEAEAPGEEPEEPVAPTEESEEPAASTEESEETTEETVEEIQAAEEKEDPAEEPTEKFHIWLEPNGGTLWGQYPESYLAGETVKLPDRVLRVGYRFLGWYEDGQRVTEIDAESRGDRAFVALWKEKQDASVDFVPQYAVYDGTGKSVVLKDEAGNVLPSKDRGWMMPAASMAVLRAFGVNEAPNQGALTYHQGVDLAAANSEVWAAQDGVVGKTGYSEIAGEYVIINHGDGYSSFYSHLGGWIVNMGQTVRRGDLIGWAGLQEDTVGVSMYVLHFGISYNGVYINPAVYLDLSNSTYYIVYGEPKNGLNPEGLPTEVGTYHVYIQRGETEDFRAVRIEWPNGLEIQEYPHGNFDGIQWELQDGVLTLNGYGAIPAINRAPWGQYQDMIREIQLCVYTPLNPRAFAGIQNLEKVTIDSSGSIGADAFADCGNLKTVVFTANVPWQIDVTAFTGVEAEVHYTVGEYNTYMENRWKDYGGSLTWVEHGQDAKLLTLNVEQVTMRLGEERTLRVNPYPYDATADCAYSVDQEGIVEIGASAFRSCTLQAVAPGTVTLTAVDRRTGLSVTCRIKVVSQKTKVIKCPYEEKITQEKEDEAHYYSFTPEQSGYYAGIVRGISGALYESVSCIVRDGEEYISWIYYAEDKNAKEYIYYLVEGKTYSIEVDGNEVWAGGAGSFQWFRAKDKIERVVLEQDELLCDVGDDGWTIGLSAKIEPFGAYSQIQWVNSDFNVAKIDAQYNNSCEIHMNSRGRTVVTALCGGKMASVSIIGRDSLPLKEGQDLELKGDTQYGERIVSFQAKEQGRYAFTVANESGNAGIFLSGGCYDYWKIYGSNSETVCAGLDAGQTVYLHISMPKGETAILRAEKITDPPKKLELVCKTNQKNYVYLAASFTPQNTSEQIIKWEIETPEILGKTGSYDAPYTLSLIPYRKGEATVTAVSESGLRASITLTVGQCFESHNFESTVVEPTCTAEGYTRDHCPDCYLTQIRDRVPALGHQLVPVEAKAPTYMEPGNNAYYVCRRCSGIYKDEAGTVETTLAAEAIPKLEGPELDRSPYLEAKSLTLNSYGEAGVSIGLVERFGNAVRSVTVYDYDKAKKTYGPQPSGSFEAEAYDGYLTLRSLSVLKNGTYALKLTADCQAGSYDYLLQVKVTNRLPKVTVKQLGKFNLFYRDGALDLTVAAAGEEIGRVELADTADFCLDWQDGQGRITYQDSENIPSKPDTKAALNVYPAGYRVPVKVNLNIAAGNTAPVVKQSRASSILNTALTDGKTAAVALLDQKGQPLEVRDLTVRCDTPGVTAVCRGNVLYLTAEEAKAANATVYIRDSHWVREIKLTHRLYVQTKLPTVTLGARTLKLSSTFSARAAQTVVKLNQNNLELSAMTFRPTAKEGTAAYKNAMLIDLSFDPETGAIQAAFRDPQEKAAKGTYVFAYQPVLSDGTELAEGRLSVSVAPTALKVKLSAASVKLNRFLAGQEQGAVRVTVNDSTCAVAGFAGLPECLDYDEETGILRAVLPDGTYTGGSYKLYPIVRDLKTDQEIELGTALAFKVQTYSSSKLTVSLAPKGKLDTLTDSEILYTVTKLGNCLGTPEAVALEGPDGEKFQAELDLTGVKPVVRLARKPGERYAINRAYKVAFRLEVCGQEILSSVQTVKVTQSSLKVTAAKTAIYCQAQKSPLRLSLKTSVPLEEIALGSGTAKELGTAIGDVRFDGSQAELEMEDPGKLKPGKSYTLVLALTPEGNGENKKPTEVRVTVKVVK